MITFKNISRGGLQRPTNTCIPAFLNPIKLASIVFIAYRRPLYNITRSKTPFPYKGSLAGAEGYLSFHNRQFYV